MAEAEVEKVGKARRDMMIPNEIRETTRTDPIGRCIYCGGRKGLLDEHIIPYGLGGNLVLPEASCKDLRQDH